MNQRLWKSNFTIADTEGRKNNLRATSKDADTKRSGSGLFLFGCEKDYSLKNQEAVLQAILLSAKDSNKHSF